MRDFRQRVSLGPLTHLGPGAWMCRKSQKTRQLDMEWLEEPQADRRPALSSRPLLWMPLQGMPQKSFSRPRRHAGRAQLGEAGGRRQQPPKPQGSLHASDSRRAVRRHPAVPRAQARRPRQGRSTLWPRLEAWQAARPSLQQARARHPASPALLPRAPSSRGGDRSLRGRGSRRRRWWRCLSMRLLGAALPRKSCPALGRGGHGESACSPWRPGATSESSTSACPAPASPR
mmetsp:Transcript_53157/g.164482  ORF Transcript_53157/g.164482 Transcript_53157/m.164482 type:complete len:231 (-) Transcript_53157:741-1433(-)